MLHTRTRTLAAIGTTALLAVTLVGCGGSDDKKDGAKADPTTSSTASAGETDSSSDDATPDADADASGEAVDAEAFVDDVVSRMRDQKTAHMVIQIGSSMAADADVVYGDRTAMHMKMTTGGQNMDAVLLGQTMYIRTSAAAKYIKIDKNSAGSEALLSQFQNLTPAKSVAALKGAVKKVVDQGEVEVDGDTLRKYVLTVDTKAISQQLGQAVAGADLPRTITYSMWLDDDKLLRRVEMSVSGQKVVMKVTDWGKDVDIKAPPAGQVQALPKGN